MFRTKIVFVLAKKCTEIDVPVYARLNQSAATDPFCYLAPSDSQTVNYILMHLETVASLMNQSIGFRIKQNQNCLFRGYVVPLPRFVFRGLVPLCKFISINHNNLPCLSSLVKSGILFEKIIIST